MVSAAAGLRSGIFFCTVTFYCQACVMIAASGTHSDVAVELRFDLQRSPGSNLHKLDISEV